MKSIIAETEKLLQHSQVINLPIYTTIGVKNHVLVSKFEHSVDYLK